MSQLDLQVVLRAAQRIPSLPQVIPQALQILEDPDWSVPELAKVIALDQALAARMLQWANSPFYGLRGKVSTLEHAIMMLGPIRVRNLLLTASVSEMLTRKMPGYGLESGDLWRHSVMVAAGSQWLATVQRYPHPGEVFLAGLLHDIGKLVLNELLCLEKTWQAEWLKLQKQGVSFTELECWLTGLDHAQLGQRVAETWNLPPVLCEAIAYHHEPHRATIEPRVTYWVHVADIAALMLGIGLGYDGLSYELNLAAFPIPDFGPSDFEALMEFEATAIKEAEAMLHVDPVAR